MYFFIYAILGRCVEVIHAALKRGKFENRGFLNGCWRYIYGVGVVLVLLCLTPININVFVLFIVSLALTSFLEFIVGFVLEKQLRKTNTNAENAGHVSEAAIADDNGNDK